MDRLKESLNVAVGETSEVGARLGAVLGRPDTDCPNDCCGSRVAHTTANVQNAKRPRMFPQSISGKIPHCAAAFRALNRFFSRTMPVRLKTHLATGKDWEQRQPR